MKETIYTVYGLTTVKDNYKVRYVGVTRATPQRRYQQHMKDCRKYDWRVYRWIRKRIDEGFEIIMVSIENNAPTRYSEIFWINNYREKYTDLLNSEMVYPCREAGYTISDEHKRKISYGIRNSKVWAPRRGHTLNDEHKAKISAGLLASGRDYTEQSKKTAAKLTGRKLSPEHVAALKAAKRPGWSEERKAKAAITNADPAVKLKRSIAAKNRSSSAEARQKLSDRGRLGSNARWKNKLLE